jgi:anti-sigma B factor antagonist
MAASRPELQEEGMRIDERWLEPVMVLDVTGRLGAGDGVGLLKDKINSVTLQGHRQILLNLGGVPHIDSSGLGELVAARTTVARSGGEIKLLNLTARVQDLLAICRLSNVFETFDSEADALQSFAGVSRV